MAHYGIICMIIRSEIMNKKLVTFIKNNSLYLLITLISLILIIFVVFPTFSETTTSSIWNGTLATSFHSGTGSYNDPYEINTGSELAYFKSVMNQANYFNKYYILSNNVNLNNLDFSNINSGTFSGSFNGNGYAIYNYKIENNYSINGQNYYGLFDNLNSATISDLNIYNVTLNINN